MNKITVGSKIPLFSLSNQNSEQTHIFDYVGKKNMVIYFYPKDDTPGCTAEACSFRDEYEDFKLLDAEVIGISADSPESHKNFATKHNLSFTLLSDDDNKLRNQFGVPTNLFGLLPGRVTYIVDKKGVVKHIFNSQLNARRHVLEAKKILIELNSLENTKATNKHT